MDTDGTIDKDGHCEFTQVDYTLIKQVSQLLSSLGIKNNVTYKEVSNYIKQDGNVAYTYRINFRTDKQLPCFKLTRKYNRLPDKWKNTRNRSLIDELDEDTNIEIVVSKANGKEIEEDKDKNNEEDKEWQDEVNNSVTIRGMTEEEKKEQNKNLSKASRSKSGQPKTSKNKGKTKNNKKSQAELDYWPDDFEE